MQKNMSYFTWMIDWVAPSATVASGGHPEVVVAPVSRDSTPPVYCAMIAPIEEHISCGMLLSMLPVMLTTGKI